MVRATKDRGSRREFIGEPQLEGSYGRSSDVFFPFLSKFCLFLTKNFEKNSKKKFGEREKTLIKKFERECFEKKLKTFEEKIFAYKKEVWQKKFCENFCIQNKKNLGKEFYKKLLHPKIEKEKKATTVPGELAAPSAPPRRAAPPRARRGELAAILRERCRGKGGGRRKKRETKS
jgi:hypothetical protein